MKAHTTKPHPNISRFTATGKKTASKAQLTAGWTGHRREAAQANELQNSATGSPKIRQAAQLQDMATAATPLPISNSANKFTSETFNGNQTELSDQLKGGIYAHSGLSINPEVHLNSSKPAELDAYAYAQGNHIYVAPGQEKHIPHEAWHVVQQVRGKVKPTRLLNGYRINDNPQLENEADAMGAEIIRIHNYLSKKKAEEVFIQAKNQNCSKGASPISLPYKPIIQCGKSRVNVPDTRLPNGVDIMPTLNFGEYYKHVELRTIAFFIVTLKVRRAVEDAGKNPIPTLLTDHAAAQTGIGLRGQSGIQYYNGTPVHGTDKIDAAHRMNTTLNVHVATSLGVPQTLADELHAISAGTSQQFQASNITADKIIDGCQTKAKNEMFSSVSKTDEAFLDSHLKNYLESCEKELLVKIKAHPIPAPGDSGYLKAKSYEIAYQVIVKQLNDIKSVKQEIINELTNL